MSRIRRCIACREEATPTELVRLAAGPNGRLVIDYRGRLPGRGAWIHPHATCVAAVQSRPGILMRALSVTEPDLDKMLRVAVMRAASDGLSQAAAAGALIGGHEKLKVAIAKGDILHVVTASDASSRTLEALRIVAVDIPFTELPVDRVAMGAKVGKGARAALGIRRSRSASHLLTQLHRLSKLG